MPAHRVAVWWGITSQTAWKTVVFVLTLTLGGVLVWSQVPSPRQVQVPEDFFTPAHEPAFLIAGPASAPDADGPGEVVFVHVAGAVLDPGLVELPDTARVAQAIDLAGGPAPGADLAAVNLAAHVGDGEQIYVPTLEEDLPPPKGEQEHQGGLVNLNTATESQLQELPGIGPVMAGRIVTHRETNGGFSSVDDLQSVPGIGPSIMAQIRSLVDV